MKLSIISFLITISITFIISINLDEGKTSQSNSYSINSEKTDFEIDTGVYLPRSYKTKRDNK